MTIKDRLHPSVFDLVSAWLNNECVVKIAGDRRSKLGDYIFAPNKGHQITVNGSLNDYSFVITLVHEIAHYHAQLKFNNTIPPHGKEWKNIYSQLLFQVFKLDFFPEDLRPVLAKHISKPKASSYADLALRKALMKYDESFDDSLSILEELEEGDLFELENKRQFKILEKRRTRFMCELIGTGKRYLVSKMAMVKKMPK